MDGDENSHKNLRKSAYQYVSNNKTKFYDYCYIENNMYYIDIKEGEYIKKYVLDEYVEKIKKNKFFAGFIEINAMSIFLNRPIVILEDIYYNNKKFYKKIAVFNNTDFNSLTIDDIIFINFQNNNHYELLIPNKNFIINRINKITIPEVKQLIIANANNSQYNLHKKNNSNNKGCNENRNIEKTNAKETVSNTTIKCKEEKSTDSQNNKNIKLVKNI